MPFQRGLVCQLELLLILLLQLPLLWPLFEFEVFIFVPRAEVADPVLQRRIPSAVDLESPNGHNTVRTKRPSRSN